MESFIIQVFVAGYEEEKMYSRGEGHTQIQPVVFNSSSQLSCGD